MATPPRENILDNIQTTLEGITVAGGYKTTVVTVERVIRDWHAVGLRPWVGYMPQTQQYSHYAFQNMRVILPIYIAAHVNATTKALAQEAITNLEDDIIAVMMVDPTRGGHATFTAVVSQRDDVGDPDTMDSRGAGGTLEIIMNVVYHRTIEGS